jgi:hypothetical protein
MGEPTFKIIVAHALISPWKEILEEGQLRTWAPASQSDVLHVYGKPLSSFLQKIDSKYWNLKWSKIFGKPLLIFEFLFFRGLKYYKPNIEFATKSYTLNDRVILMPDSYLFSIPKTLAFHRMAANLNADYIIFTTSSSYINISKLKEALRNAPREKFVGGRIVNSKEKQFISGSFRVYSKDVISFMKDDVRKFRWWLAEDLAIGIYLTQNGYDLTDLPSLDLDSIDAVNNVSHEALEKTLHFRLKSGVGKLRNDVSIMHQLHTRITAIGQT